MDVEEYRAARRTRLVERAVELGLPPDEAGLVVDRVIVEQRRRIRRADDPDDVVVPALGDAILGRARGGRTTTLVVLLAVAAVVVAVPVAYVTRDDPAPVIPSLFGLTTGEATRALERDDIASRVVEVPQCNPAGQVLGSDPPPGSAVGTDEVVVLIATSTPEWRCPDDAAARARAWTFLRFLVSGTERPGFAPGVRLFVDGEEVTVVGGAEPAAAPGWQSVVRDPVLAYASRPAANPLGQPVDLHLLRRATTDDVRAPPSDAGRGRPPVHAGRPDDRRRDLDGHVRAHHRPVRQRAGCDIRRGRLHASSTRVVRSFSRARVGGTAPWRTGRRRTPPRPRRRDRARSGRRRPPRRPAARSPGAGPARGPTRRGCWR